MGTTVLRGRSGEHGTNLLCGWGCYVVKDSNITGAVTTITANGSTNKVNIVEVDKSYTVRVTSGVFGPTSNSGLYSLTNCHTGFNGIVYDNRTTSSTITLIFQTPGDCANRGAIRVSIRNKLCVIRGALRTTFRTNTIPTRPNRFAGHTFLGNGVSLARTRDITRLVSTGNRATTGTDCGLLRNSLDERVSNILRGLRSASTLVTT